MSLPIEALKLRLGALRESKEQTLALYQTFLSLHLVDENVQVHKILHDLDIRIEQIEMLVERYSKKPD
jgi:hypothetical protein